MGVLCNCDDPYESNFFKYSRSGVGSLESGKRHSCRFCIDASL
ncbi:MAG: hypothetical protein IKL96_04050 [Kiritimatiellae bacterium]|nr:hypothetical protein [Kiritimatiellia bacterium]